jgi:hypothetical protein
MAAIGSDCRQKVPNVSATAYLLMARWRLQSCPRLQIGLIVLLVQILAVRIEKGRLINDLQIA